MAVRFKCLDGCNYCCIWRDYYATPNTLCFDLKTGKYQSAYEYLLGKMGISIQPSEVSEIQRLAKKLGKRIDESGEPIQYQILPQTAISRKDAKQPERIVEYQLMGRTKDGDICPFLSTVQESIKTPSGALACLIYPNRPLCCRAYPLKSILVEEFRLGKTRKVALLDKACQWVVQQLRENGWIMDAFRLDEIYGLDYSAMIRIQRGKYRGMQDTTLWHYATGIHNQSDPAPLYTGWVNWGWDIHVEH